VVLDAPSTSNAQHPPQSHSSRNIPSPTAKWRKQEPPVTNSDFLGAKFSFDNSDHPPIWYFKQFFDENLVTWIADQSNLYCMQEKLAKNLNCKDLKATPTEVQSLLGIFLFMGIYPNPNYRSYWSGLAPNAQIQDALDGGMSRFESLKRFLHFNDNSERAQNCADKLYKVRPVIDSVLEKCKKLEPEEYNSIDEQMIPTKSRSTIKQYMPKKPHKWGYKVFSRCGISGMLYDFEIYTGKKEGPLENSHLGITGDLVMRLCKSLPKHMNFKVFFDNFFTSIPLIRELRKDGILSLGTIRSNRMLGASKVLRSDKDLKKDQRGSSDWRTDVSSNVTVLKWYDNNIVHLASCFIGPHNGDTVRRWSQAEKKHLEIECPLMVNEYNKFMGGVDLCDMLLSLYRIKLKSRRWYMPIFYYLLKVCVTNGWLLYRRYANLSGVSVKSQLTLINFQSQVAFDLINIGKLSVASGSKKGPGRPLTFTPPTKKRKTVGVPIPLGESRYDQVGHFPIYSEQQNRCRLCPNGRSRWKCSKCEMFLCLVKERNCFFNFHVKH